jgi:hypothetical protein
VKLWGARWGNAEGRKRKDAGGLELRRAGSEKGGEKEDPMALIAALKLIKDMPQDLQPKAELLLAGSAGKGTTGSPEGILDRGSNSIDALVAEVPKQVRSTIDEADPKGAKQIALLIWAHSRGSVAADIVATQLKEFYDVLERPFRLGLVVIDLVPGRATPARRRKSMSAAWTSRLWSCRSTPKRASS